MKKTLCLALCALWLGCLGAQAQITFGRPQNIDKDWKFLLLPETEASAKADYSAVDVADKNWRKLDLPHDWSIEGEASPSLASCTGYLPGGIGWYRKELTVGKKEAGRKQYLYFEGVYNHSEVWINGHYLGLRPSGFASFLYDITPYVQWGKKNCIAVKVDHSLSADSRWYTGSGIYRSVWLVSAHPVHIDHWGLFARSGRISAQEAELLLSTTVVNETEEDKDLQVRHRIFHREGKEPVASVEAALHLAAGAKHRNEQVALIARPALWSVDAPHLYRVETCVMTASGQVLDQSTTLTGLREIRFDPDQGFFLNGKNLKMKGVCLHYDGGALGAVVPRDVWIRRLQGLKEMGCNAIRMSHNPQARVLYDLCDEMGFLVMDEAFDEWEFPKRKWIEGWNKGKNPGYQGTSSYFAQWGARDLAHMVNRDKNHPSIVMWSIGNEVDYPNDPYSHPILDKEGINQKTIPGYKKDKPHAERIGLIAQELVPIVKAIDTSRAVTGAMAGVVMSNYTAYPGTLDVCGYNYTERRYAQDHETYPQRIIYGSENRHDYAAWLAVKDNPYIFGQFLWTGIDYLGEAGPWPSRGFISGLLDLAGYMKPLGFYRQSLWSPKAMVYVGTKKKEAVGKNPSHSNWESTWNYAAGDTISLAVFTNCPTVQVFVNNKPVEAVPQKDERTGALCMDVAYEEGTLCVKGLNGASVDAVHEVKTYREARTLELEADKKTCDKGRVIHLHIRVVDAQGTRVLNSREEIKVEVRGKGRLLTMENAQPDYMEGFKGNCHPAYKGRMMAYLQAGDRRGTLRVRVSTPGLGFKENLKIKVR